MLARDHWAVTDRGVLIGYCCSTRRHGGGAEQQPGTLDVGYGLAPDRMGRGTGGRFVAAILEFALEHHDARRLRLFILASNERSRTVAARLGFAVEEVIEAEEGEFLVMVRDREHHAP